MTDFLGRFQRLSAVLNLGLGSFALKLNRLIKPNYLMENWKLQSNKPIITLYFNCCPDWERVKRWDVLWGVDLLQMLLLWSIKVQGFSRLPFLDSLRTPHREFPDCRLFCLVVWSLSFWIGRVLYFIVSFFTTVRVWMIILRSSCKSCARNSVRQSSLFLPLSCLWSVFLEQWLPIVVMFGFFHRPGLVRTNAKVPVFVLLFKDGHYIWWISNTLLFIATSVLKVFSGWRFDQEPNPQSQSPLTQTCWPIVGT